MARQGTITQTAYVEEKNWKQPLAHRHIQHLKYLFGNENDSFRKLYRMNGSSGKLTQIAYIEEKNWKQKLNKFLLAFSTAPHPATKVPFRQLLLFRQISKRSNTSTGRQELLTDINILRAELKACVAP